MCVVVFILFFPPKKLALPEGAQAAAHALGTSNAPHVSRRGAHLHCVWKWMPPLASIPGFAALKRTNREYAANAAWTLTANPGVAHHHAEWVDS